MNWGGNVKGFLDAFRKGLGDLLGKEGTNLDGQEYINGQDPNYLKLPWDVRKKYDESVGDQSSIFGLGGPGLPGEPGVPGVPSAPKDGRPLLPGEKPLPKIFAMDFLNNFNPFA